MKPIEPAELSAYLDGELTEARHREVQAALAEHADLHAEFNALKIAHQDWHLAARQASFQPSISLPVQQQRRQTPVLVVAGLLLLIALRFLPKLGDAMLLGIILHAVALLAILFWTVKLTERENDTHFPVTI